MKLTKSLLASAVSLAFTAPVVMADESSKAGLETIEVTAQKRTQSIQEVPISIATLNGDNFTNLFASGDDVLALAVRVPGLYAESSNGRVAPRFYMRGLGNTDFDLAASQPVSVVMDNVVMENVVLKSFPLFDVEQVEVIRGPQGTLFGRNTTAGIVKFASVKPSAETDGFIKSSFGSYGTFNVEAALGGQISNNVNARVAVLRQNRDDYIDNLFTGDNEVMGGFTEEAYRLQLMYQPNDQFSALLNMHGRDYTGTASMFRANGLTTGSNKLNNNVQQDAVWYDADLGLNGIDNNPQAYENFGSSLTIEYDMGALTFTSITALETAEGYSLGDVDGGVNFAEATDYDADGNVESSFPGFIPFSAVTQDSLNDLEQFTQEFRFASNGNEALNYQFGAFFFDSSFSVTSDDGFFGATTVNHANTTWAVFAQTDYAVNEALTVTAGVRYTDDEKSLTVGEQNVNGFALVIGAASVQDYTDINVSDSQPSYEFSAHYELDKQTALFARYATGFRAQTIQGRDVAFEAEPSVADAETISSIEAGIKKIALDNRLRLNAAVFSYTIEDIQFSAIGGDGNITKLINAAEGQGYGLETDVTYMASENLTLTAGYSYNHTEINDPNLAVAPCGSGQCTVTDDLNANGQALVDGNPFPQAPQSTFSFTARYAVPMGANGELYAFTDYARQGKTNLFLYESKEFHTDGNDELGLRVGYVNFADDYEVALFGRNITNEVNLKGGIDFNNNTVIINEPRVVGIELLKRFY